MIKPLKKITIKEMNVEGAADFCDKNIYIKLVVHY